MNNWQPIETAPKDGSTILLWAGRATFGCWQNYYDISTIDLPEDEWKIETQRWEDDGEGFEIDPTHWQPSPGGPDG